MSVIRRKPSYIIAVNDQCKQPSFFVVNDWGTAVYGRARSTWDFILLLGYYNLQRFALLHHTPAHYTSSLETESVPSSSGSSSDSSSDPSSPSFTEQKVYTAKSALIKLLKIIGEDLITFIPCISDTPIEYIDLNLIHSLKLLVGGSIEHDYDLIHDGFNLLNDKNNSHKVQAELKQHPLFYLIPKSNDNVKILRPMTYYQSKELTRLGNCS